METIIYSSVAPATPVMARGEAEQADPGAGPPASLPYLAKFQTNERLCHKQKVEDTRGRMLEAAL